jgi:hypothetical protein
VLTVNSVALADGTDFRVSGLLGAPFTVDPGSSWTGTITLDPQTPGALSDTLVIQSDDPDEATVNVALDGTAWIGVGVWRREGVAVTAYDTLAPLDANLGDIRVWVLMRRGELLGVSRVVLGGQQPMDGVGILIQGADYRCRVIDARRGPIGELAFIASDSSLASVDLRGSIRGTDLNGMTLGGVHLAADLDADGELADLTALYVNGQLGAAKLAGSLGGDVLIGGSLGSLQAGGSLSGDMTVGGNAGDLRVAGEFGVPGSRLTVGGSLRSLLVGSRGAAADLVADVAVLGSLGRATIYGNICAPVTVQGGLGTLTARLICDRVSVAGDLGSLTTSSDLQPGSHPVDFHFHNPGAEADGSLTVDGLIRRIRHG